MKKNITILSSIVILMVVLLSGCSTKNNNAISTTTNNIKIPDKIILYGNEKQITVNKDDSTFKRIYELINIRFPIELSTAKMEVSCEAIESQKSTGLAVEFLYDKTQETEIYNGNNIKIQYTSIFFPLNGIYENVALIIETNNFPIPVGLCENSDDLVNALTK